MKRRFQCVFVSFIMVICLLGCGQESSTPETLGEKEVQSEVQPEKKDEPADGDLLQDDEAAQPEREETGPDEDGAQSGDEAEEEPEPPFMPGYDTFDDWRARHLGSVGLITDRTVLVSIYLNEPGDDVWDEADIDYTRQMMDIGYGYLKGELAGYGAETDLIFDSRKNSDLFYMLDIDEEIPDYVTTERERELDVSVDKWLTNIPVQELMQKYEADSIGFLFFINHEGCSYSSMHFIDDGMDTWDECCMIYLQDMYRENFEYETPATYAHELLHLFGAEDLYKSANVFSAETYAYVGKYYPEDIMINTFQKINGKYVVQPDKVVKEISPVTAYLIGVAPDDIVRENCPELLKDETGCFSGSTYDREF